MLIFLISIIIPVYNVERYLEQCLKSVIINKSDAVEVIIINDASTDQSLKICKKFQKKDTRIQLLDLKENIGLGAVRNLGIQKATGDYIWFIDSDDWIEENALQKLLEFVNKDTYDIVYFGIRKVGEKDRVVLPEFEDFSPTFFRDGLKTLKGIHPMVWCSLFSRSFLIRNKIVFPEGIYLEDVPFTVRAQYYCKKLGVIKESFYNYRIHEASITQSASKKKIDDSFTAHLMIKDFLDKEKVFENYKKDFIIRMLSCCVLPSYVDYFKMPKKFIDKELKSFMKQVRKSDLLIQQNIFLLKEMATELDQQKPNGGKFFKRAYGFLFGIRYAYGFFKLLFITRLSISRIKQKFKKIHK